MLTTRLLSALSLDRQNQQVPTLCAPWPGWLIVGRNASCLHTMFKTIEIDYE